MRDIFYLTYTNTCISSLTYIYINKCIREHQIIIRNTLKFPEFSIAQNKLVPNKGSLTFNLKQLRGVWITLVERFYSIFILSIPYIYDFKGNMESGIYISIVVENYSHWTIILPTMTSLLCYVLC